MLEIIGRYWERDSLGCGAANPSWGVTKVDWWSEDQAGELRVGSVTKSITNIINIIISGGILALASTFLQHSFDFRPPMYWEYTI